MKDLKSSDLKVLDCTLRDGGYYNNWDFSQELVNSYLISMANSNIDIVEIGFRFLPKNSFMGPFAYSTDEYLSSLALPEDALIGVMINAKEILNFQEGIVSAIEHLFCKAEDSPVDLVRIAAHFTEYKDCHPLVKKLHKLGYKIGFNLMQAGGRSKEDLSTAAKEISKWSELEVLYFADSLGNMKSENVSNTIKAFRDGGWKKAIGIHTHDNLGEGLNNSLVAIDYGAEWVDATVLGMGRGPGNARMEYLLIELKKRDIGNYLPDALFAIVLNEFSNLHREYGWGQNLLYYLSADYGIHPTYVQEMSAKVLMDAHQQVEALEFLNKLDSSGFDKKNLNQAFLNEGGKKEGSWSCKDWLRDETVLIVGPGPSSAIYLEAIKKFIDVNKPRVISLNINKDLPSSYIDAYAACHHMRVLMDANKYQKLDKPLIIPIDAVPSELKDKLSKLDILDYGMIVTGQNLEFGDNGCVIPKRLVFSYILAMTHSSGAKRILLAGFDGYSQDDLRQEEMEEILTQYKNKQGAIEIIAITPSTYSVEQSSVYNLSL